MAKNKAFFEVELCGKCRKIETNEVEVHTMDIEVEKHVRCNHVIKGETVGFIVKIHNKGHRSLRNVEFHDILERDLDFMA